MAQDPHHEYHAPVMVDEVVELIAPVMPGVVVDATFGGGGHSRRLIEAFGNRIRIVGVDRDPDALANAGTHGVTAVLGNFADLGEVVGAVLDEAPAAVLFDFGVSSHQVDTPERGFSYRQDGPLDMRMGPDAPHPAHEIVNEWPEAELARILRRFGEEPFARVIAAAIVKARPIETTGQLSTVIAAAVPPRRAGHPARRTFQAIRIAVNGEIEAVEAGLDQAIELVRPGGRVIAISYHSLEDRATKSRFAEGATGCICPPGLPVCGCGRSAELRVLTRKPVRASDAEVQNNRRARSAVLRAAEKVAA